MKTLNLILDYSTCFSLVLHMTGSSVLWLHSTYAHAWQKSGGTCLHHLGMLSPPAMGFLSVTLVWRHPYFPFPQFIIETSLCLVCWYQWPYYACCISSWDLNILPVRHGVNLQKKILLIFSRQFIQRWNVFFITFVMNYRCCNICTYHFASKWSWLYNHPAMRTHSCVGQYPIPLLWHVSKK
jgi:hypothetical protein